MLMSQYTNVHEQNRESLPHLGGYPFLKIPERIETNKLNRRRTTRAETTGWLCNADDAEKSRMPMDGWVMSQPLALHI
jgi:hypothetical protein